MLGWMLKRGDASNAVQENADDTSQLDQPDTPAPLFAARAFKTALFGSPSRRHQTTQNRHLRKMASYSRAGDDRASSTPSKPPGILLTPGTGTARRKRVSFGNEPGADNVDDAADQQNTTTRKRSRLTEAMSLASTNKSQPASASQTNEQGSSDEWEEDDDEDYSAHDITVDLNDPHSQSGKYWKAELHKYQTDAKAEMEKLLKYKQLAKTYAHERDEEVIRMAERLKEEQQRVIQMEQMIATNTSDIASKQKNVPGNNQRQAELVDKLSKQSALATQYRERVQELEEKLEDLLLDKKLQANSGQRRQPEPSPGSQKTLLETQRELRHARNQVKEMGLLREQLAALKDQLKKAKTEGQQRDEKDKRETPRARELRAQLRDMQHESKRKDEEMAALKAEFEAFRKETEVHDTDMRTVLERAHNKIADLKKEVKTLKTADGAHGRPKSWHAPAEEEARGRGSDEIATRERRSHDLDGPGDEYQHHTSKKSRTTARNSEDEKRKWQPFVPRTPRERRYAGEEVERRMDMDDAATTKAARKPQSLDAPSLPAVSHRAARESKSSKQDNASSGVDLLRHRFARLGGPDMGNDNQRNQAASRSALPPERRAAALARIEKRMAEKKRARARTSADKENVWP